MIDFKNTYNQDEILDFLKNLFLKDFQKDIRTVDVPDQKYIQEAYSLGYSSELELSVFEFLHEGSTEKRVTLTKEAFNVLRDSGSFKAIGIFHSKDTDDWRFSLMTATPVVNEKGKVKTVLSNPKRYSFLLGPNAKVNTPTKFLVTKGEIQDFEDLKERFSIEVVNKEFYKEISNLFIQLVGGTLGKGRSKEEYKALLRLPGVRDSSQTAQEFAVRLIGRLIFCWFLREKKNGSEESLMPHSLLSFEASKNYKNYYHDVLEPIFFKVLNVPLGSRKDERFSSDPYDKIPYLNGGLFSPHDDDFYSTNESKQEDNNRKVIVPDKWLQELFEILETYNFTIDENSAFDEELSIDPEMLGRIFENLLAEINPETGESARKSTGSYYTPRVIVDYMVDESLYLYLKNKTDIEEEKLRSLISYDLDDDTYTPLTHGEKEKIITAIDELKILDPACGSGAFPMGALQKIVFILQQLDPNGQYWFKAQIKNVPVELRKNLEREHSEKNFDYIRKLGVIRRNIFGVDIQPIATEISRLRCFLTLIVDQKVDDDKDNRGIDPLPNLDFKFVTANSLIGLPKTQIKGKVIPGALKLYEDNTGIDELRDIREEYFGVKDLFERETLKGKFKDIQKEMALNIFKGSYSGIADLTEALMNWDPFTHKQTSWFDIEWMFGIKEGVDIIIGNPPYVRQEEFKDIKEELSKEFPGFFNGRADLFTYFIKAGANMLENDGHLTLIVSNKFFVRGYGQSARSLLKNEMSLLNIVNFGELPVFQASVDSAIIIARKREPSEGDSIKYAQAESEEDIDNIQAFLNSKVFSIKANSLGEKVWSFLSRDKFVVLEKIQKNQRTIGSFYKGEIFAGIKSGLDSAFVINEKMREELIAKDSKSMDLIKPWLRGRDIKKWKADYKNLYVIYIPQNRINIEEYPAIKNHLLKHKEGLEKRATKQDWFEMQQPQERFTKLFESSEKIIYGEIAKEMRACFDGEKSYGTMKMFFIPYHPIILGILNSKLFDWYSRNTFATLGDPWNGGRISFNTMYMDRVPIPEIDNIIGKQIKEKVERILDIEKQDDRALSIEAIKETEAEIDQLVYRLYELNEQEINIITGSYK